jgi:hypothetical protein
MFIVVFYSAYLYEENLEDLDKPQENTTNDIDSDAGQDPRPSFEPDPGYQPPDTPSNNVPTEPVPDPGQTPEPPSPPEPEPSPELLQQPLRSWTSFFYVAYDNSIGPQLAWESDKMYLEAVGSSDELNLVALVDQEYDDDCSIEFIQKGSSWTYTVSEIDPSWPDELDTGSPEVLYKFLSWGVQMFPAEHYNFHIMDHGGAWMGFCTDDSEGTMIDAWEVREVFAKIKSEIGRNIDLISIDACYMSNLAFAYEISESVDYLNGLEGIATGDFDEEGNQLANWKYTEIWQGLRDNPHWTAEEFALHQLDNMYEIGPYLVPSIMMGHIQCTDAFGVSDLNKITDFIEAFDELSNELYESVTGSGEHSAEEQLIVRIIGHAESPPDFNTESFHGQLEVWANSPFKLYDLGDFLDRLLEYGDRLCFKETAKQAKILYQEVIVGCVHGDDAKIGEHPDASGLNVYIPYRTLNYLDEYASTRLAQDTMWDDFLNEVGWI